MSRRSETIHPLAAFATGVLMLAAGVWLARQNLPEWGARPLEKEAYVQRFQELARQAGVRLQPGAPRVSLTTDDEGGPGGRRILDGYSPELVSALGGGLRVKVEQEAVAEAGKRDHLFQVELEPDGTPRRVVWAPLGFDLFVTATQGPPASPEKIDRFAAVLLAPGETLGGKRQNDFPRNQEAVYDLQGSQPPQHLSVATPSGDLLMIMRRTGAANSKDREESTAMELTGALPVVLFALSIPILFVALITRRRIGLTNAAVLAGVSFVASLPILFRDPSIFRAVEAIVAPGFRALWMFLVWSVGESLLRAVQPGFTTSLDALRAGRLGPRGGRALLYGLATGAVLGGFRLATDALAMAAPGIWPQDPDPRLPVFGNGNPFLTGCTLAASIAVVAALAWRWLPPRWAPWVAVLAGALAIQPQELAPYPLELAAGLATTGLLVLTLHRFGLTALLVGAVFSYVLPAGVFSGFHLDWLPGTFLGTAGLSAALLAAGLVGLRRPERVEIERVRQPAFIRRLEEERRVKYEMDLLSRMQLGLLPAQLPQVPGWEIAARSILATEAGGDLYDVISDEEGNLWVANGDVAGHGYSCAIAQSMTVAALTSLIIPGATPGQVLQGVDRVIRRSGTHRHFTSLALLRIESASGDALLSNAGHPFPLLLSLGGEVMEIDLPGLPLGQGPKRRYGELCIVIPPGGALVFASDGLFEGANWQDDQYGYERPQELLRNLGDASAPVILEALFADWRRHLGDREHQDDTTVLVIKRK